ncbi:MAG: enoyl-CoA hydratase [Halioglobus sp.]|nr:enoyl-CoA hydratase [Halioglobus sp.]
MSDDNVIEVRREGPVEWLALNRPDAHNTLNLALVDALVDYFEGLRERHDVRIVVLGAKGKHFCAGLDLSPDAFADIERSTANTLVIQRRIARIYLAMRKCPQPIIAMVHGAACGGGFSLALAADIRIAGESAKMNAAYIKIGLSGCDMGSSYFLPRLVGTSVASEYLMTGRFIHAERALAVNLVSQIVPDRELAAAAQDYIQDMLRTSPAGLRLTKDGLNIAVDAPGLEAAMAVEDRQQALLSLTEDAREAGLAFFEKRDPVYRDR